MLMKLTTDWIAVLQRFAILSISGSMISAMLQINGKSLSFANLGLLLDCQ